MSDSIGVVLLAAGKGTRLGIDTAKPLCEALGSTLISYVIAELEVFAAQNKVESKMSLVVGHKKEEIKAHLAASKPELSVAYAWQKEQLGTGHALQSYFEEVAEGWDHKYTLVVCADTPLITSETYTELLCALKSEEAEGVCATFDLFDPRGYGRIIRADQGFSIIEEKDATAEQRHIKEVNSGLYIFKTSYIKEHLYNLENKNKSGEFYITDLLKPGNKVVPLKFESPEQFKGVNNLIQLEEASNILQQRVIQKLQLDGVRFMNSKSVYIEPTVKIAKESVIYPNVTIMGDTQIASGSIIESGVTIKNSKLSERVLVKSNSYIEGAIIKKGTSIGPMAHLRPGSIIGENCKLGNFVEIKNTELNNGAKVSHLSYLGDAQIGENTNIGCGFITCNYDGANKHKTIIGANSFIGSDCQVIAPINIGNNAYVGSGSTINKNVPDDAFAIARQRQVTRVGMANKFMKIKTKE